MPRRLTTLPDGAFFAAPVIQRDRILFVVLAWWLAARRRRAGASDDVVYALAPLACTLSLLIFAPILSPQYIVWFLPFSAILAASGRWLIAGLTLAITAVTTVSYITVPSAAEGALYGTLPVLVRNLLLVALFVVALQELAGVRAGTAARADAAVPTEPVRSSPSA